MLDPVLNRVRNYSTLNRVENFCVCWTGSGFGWVGQTPYPNSCWVHPPGDDGDGDDDGDDHHHHGNDKPDTHRLCFSFCRFCKLCLEILQNAESAPACPLDGSPCTRDQTFADKCAQKEILALQCACPKKSQGCRWTGPLASVGVHTDCECAFTKVECLFASAGCQAMLLRYQLAKHVEKDCPYRIIKCIYCGDELSEIKTATHLEKCPKRHVICPHGCGEKGLARNTVDKHVSLQCPEAPVACDLAALGCGYQGSRKTLKGHIDNSLGEHLSLSIKRVKELDLKVNELQEKLEKTVAGAVEHEAVQKQKLGSANEKLAALKTRVAAAEGLISSHNETGGITAMKNQLALQEKRLSSLEAADTRAGPEPSRKIEQLEKLIALQDIQMADLNLKVQHLESTSFDGTFLWKIDDFPRRMNEAVSGKNPSILSPPFFTGRHGYKVCARLYPNGDGLGKGHYVSLFFVIMQGECDAMLPWPFQQTVTFKLLDQERTHQDVTEMFAPDPNSPSFQRPAGQMNIASGCPQFCPHAVLHSGRFIKDNTLFIKVVT